MSKIISTAGKQQTVLLLAEFVDYSLARQSIAIRIHRFAHAAVHVRVVQQLAYALLNLLAVGADQ